MTKERLFKKAYAAELLRVAEGDLETAQILANSSLKRKENLFFHIQQAIEKSLKAYLCWLEKPVPLVHDLALILDRFPEEIEIPAASQLTDFTQFATVRRYEEGTFVLSDEETKASLLLANKIIVMVQGKIK